MKTLLKVGAVVGVLGAGSAMAQERLESSADMRGLTFLIGGGIEGYTNSLGSDINPGLGYGVTVAIKPTKVLGIELGYSGAINNFDRRVLTGSTSGPDLVRNGAHALATLGLGAAPLQPYVLGGVGLSRYNVRAPTLAFSDDTVANVPVGGGLRLHMGSFTADARVHYNFLLDQEFAANVPPGDVTVGDRNFSSGGSYAGTLNIGATW
ncbi:hypothetical protein [Comamonas sp. JC664]|uniref:hypothetical protein n=1 Tax=Comamonas sp. JC664 TaxID=2801917 RepID=UPI00174E7CAB|nr:hypothetical protein [Comamonas sp. JC664]MBL0693735.1 hypothetical protein [Comamonas sp. JC664]GHG74135.1 hypothetical protein GCM10012319_21600 [Comamonas sp. KCTC 72670]